ARQEVSLACVIPADEMAGPWKAFLPGIRGRPAVRIHDARLPLCGFLIGLHETLQRILRCDTPLQQGEGLRAVRRVRVRLGRDGADPGLGEGHDGSDGDKLRFDRDPEVLRLGTEPDDAEGRRPGMWHGSGHRLAGYSRFPQNLSTIPNSDEAAMYVLLDMYGVLLDHEKTFLGYRERLADLLAARFGGSPDAWRQAHDEAFVTYTRRANETDWRGREYGEVVDELDAQHLIEMFERLGIDARPAEPLVLSRELEREAMARVNARYPDARTAIERLRAAGHKVYVATGGSETNDAALRGAGLIDLIDGIFTGHSQNAQKGQSRYWRDIPTQLATEPGDCVLVDDRLDYLEAAASAGILALLLDRKGAHRPEAMPAYVQATLRNLAGLPHWVELWTAAHGRRA